ncbi:MAG: hypothetical protein U9Q82_02680 [Chloroflexota bacterium]|nr:hypothetical protein [Chloroflexota bacterium]
MINWYNLFANALWIFALALALATLSYARWQARSLGIKRRELLNRPGWQRPLNFAGALFCTGLALTTDVWWEQLLWAILGLLFLLQIGMMWWSKRKA